MATPILRLVEENTAPDIQITCKRDNVAINLTNATIDLIIAKGSTITNAGHQSCSIVTAASGIVSYAPQDTDFPSPGTYRADVKITYADNTYEILYDQLKIKARRKLS